MLRSMYSGVSGLRNHQTMMDVIGNNISNVNTTGYKSSTAVFQDLMSQVVRGPGAPVAQGAGGTNPAQIGLGSRLGGITTNFSQGATQMTNRATDLSISGDGFFVVRQGGEALYTRAGSLNFDALGRLVTPDGGVLQGWVADAAGNVNVNAAFGDLTMPLGQNIAPTATTAVRMGGNLNASAANGTAISTSIEVFDQQGTAVNVNITFTKTAADQWQATATGLRNGAAVPVTLSGGGALGFNPATGQINTGAMTMTMGGGGFPGPIGLDFGAAGGADSLRQFSGDSTAAALNQNGSTMGTMQSFSIGPDGTITGSFSNGRTQAVGVISMATFANPVGLEKVGGSLYRPTVNSGLAQVGTAGIAGRGAIVGGTLEMSNVDLAQEFTSLIVAQRGFQANSRVITSSDELLQDLVNLKR
jgi:flagellar hook protein FlgE